MLRKKFIKATTQAYEENPASYSPASPTLLRQLALAADEEFKRAASPGFGDEGDIEIPSEESPAIDCQRKVPETPGYSNMSNGHFVDAFAAFRKSNTTPQKGHKKLETGLEPEAEDTERESGDRNEIKVSASTKDSPCFGEKKRVSKAQSEMVAAARKYLQGTAE